MAEISAGLVKELREKTGAGMMDCKRALSETQGDLENAVDWLRKKGLAAAAKKAGRTAAEGLVGVAVKGNVGESKLGVNDNNEAIIQQERQAQDELLIQESVNMRLQDDANHEEGELKECLKYLADKRLGGNGTLIGASANLTVAGIGERAGVPFRFLEFVKLALPLMLLSIAVSHLYLLWRFF